MLMSAFASIFVVSEKGLNAGLPSGLLTGMLVGGLLGLLMAFISVTLQAEQGISGIGMTLFGLGMSTLLFRVMADGVMVAESVPRLRIPLLADLPVLGEVFFNQNLLVYVAFLLVPISGVGAEPHDLGAAHPRGGPEPGRGGFDGGECRPRAILDGDSGRRHGGPGARIAVAGADGGVSGEHDRRARLHRCGAGVFRGLVAVEGDVWRPAVQRGQQSANLGAGADIRIQGEAIPANLLIMMPYMLTIIVLIFARDPAAPRAGRIDEAL